MTILPTAHSSDAPTVTDRGFCVGPCIRISFLDDASVDDISVKCEGGFVGAPAPALLVTSLSSRSQPRPALTLIVAAALVFHFFTVFMKYRDFFFQSKDCTFIVMNTRGNTWTFLLQPGPGADRRCDSHI